MPWKITAQLEQVIVRHNTVLVRVVDKSVRKMGNTSCLLSVVGAARLRYESATDNDTWGACSALSGTGSNHKYVREVDIRYITHIFTIYNTNITPVPML